MKTGLTLLCALAFLSASAPAQNPLITMKGPLPADGFGRTVACAGDVNADGSDDIAVGDPFSSIGSSAGGMVRVFSGHDGEMLHGWYGTAGQAFGASIAGVGDVNLDGYDDVAVGAVNDDSVATDAGVVYVHSGKTGAKLYSFFGSGAGDRFGASVACAGDLNLDGRPDIVIGAPRADAVIFVPQQDVGIVRVYSGANGTLLLNLKGSTAGEQFGSCVDGAGDVDGDGRDDVVIGIVSHDGATANVGRAEVRSGADGHLVFGRDGLSDWYGEAVAGAGDVNGDGLADVIVGASFHSAQKGRAEVLLGPSGAVQWTLQGDFPDDRFGLSVDGIGDVDKDGHDDVIIGGDGHDADRGFARIVSGRTGGLLYGTLYGDQQGDNFGFCVRGAGDTNGDGWRDVVVGAHSFSGAGYARSYDVLVHAPNLGKGGPGAATLAMYGAPLGSYGQMDLALKGAAPGRPVYLVASLGLGNVPFKGGTLVPAVGSALIAALVTSPQGKLLIPGIPGGNGPLSIYVQALVSDPAQPHDWALSNAIKPQLLP